MELASLAMRAAVPLALAVSAAAVWRLDDPGGSWIRRLRSRLLLGVPWGTLVTAAGILAVYLFVQGGYDNWYNPVTLPFTSWSYLYPLGVVTAPFSHSGASHLVGNLRGTLVLAPIAEYGLSHFPTERGSSSFSSWRTNPYVRAFVLFPLGVITVGVATSLLSWGPIIGFSTVVFAFGGVALVRYPVVTVIALAARGLVDTAYYALRDPVVYAEAHPTYVRPWWADIAVQGHLLGLLLGVLVGITVFSRREERPSAARIWTGTVLFAASLSVWALWWYQGGERYVLYRGLGVALVFAVGAVVVVGALASDRPLFGGLTRRQGARLLVVFPLLVMAFAAVPVNLTTVADDAAVNSSAVHVRGYTVTYAEDVPNQKAAAVNVSVLGESTNVNTSGVIVVNPDRQIWTREVSKGQLAFDGARSLSVGGLGWSETITARRLGWKARGGGTAYQVWLRVGDGRPRQVYSSPPVTADAVLAGQNVSVHPDGGAFYLVVSRENRTLDRKRVPQVNESVVVADIRFVRTKSAVVATYDGTRVPVATRETYE